MGQVKAGKLRALAITTAKRSPELPEVPTVRELGMPDVEISTWYGLYTTAGTPKAATDRFSDALTKVLALPEVRDPLTAMGLTVGFSSSLQLTSREHAYAQTWARIIKQSGFQAQ
jgi:tripartite-type tricarboxylate transporter receptor subunit TctC